MYEKPEEQEQKPKEENPDENMKHVILLNMIKAQQQELLVQSALEHLNHPVDVKIIPANSESRDLVGEKGINAHLNIKTKLIKRL